MRDILTLYSKTLDNNMNYEVYKYILIDLRYHDPMSAYGLFYNPSEYDSKI